MTTVRYFIPEDGDTEEHPNVFLAPKPSHPGMPPKLGDIKGAFPLPGKYHFRFKSPLVPGGDREKAGLAVWMDCTDDSQTVGVWRNSIIAKVTRINIEEDDDDDDDDEDFMGHRATVAATAEPVTSSRAAQVAPMSAPVTAAPAAAPSGPGLDIFDHPASTPSSMPSSTHSSAGDLLGVDEPIPVPPAATAAAAAAVVGGAESLLDFGHGVHAPAPSPVAPTLHADFIGMTASAAPHSGGYTPHAMHAASPSPPPQQQQQQMPPQQQQQQRPRTQPPSRGPPHRTSSGGNAFDQYSSRQNTGPFGDLQWS